MTTYDGHRIPQKCDRISPEQQRAILDSHPLFTGRCPACEVPIRYVGQREGQWECLECGWSES